MLQNHCICIGAQKAGTTWLFRCLQEHPDICVFPGKEMHFFSRMYTEKQIDYYYDQFKHCSTSKITFEASTSYLSDEKTPVLMAKHIPDIKLIVILRDPVQRTYSQYLHYKSRGWIQPTTPILDTLNKFPEFINNSLYGKHLKQYLNLFSESQIHIIDYNEISENPQLVIDNICNFLKIDPITPSALTTKYHSTLTRSHPLYFKISKFYVRRQKTKLGRFTIQILRFVGINNLLIDKLLQKTNNSKVTKISQKENRVLEKVFKNDQEQLRVILKEYNNSSIT